MKLGRTQFYRWMGAIRRITHSRASAAAFVAALSLAIPVVALSQVDLAEEQDELTHGAKDADALGRKAWTRVAGARFSTTSAPEPGFPVGSPTPTEIDFLDVAMKGENSAYAVGSIDVGGGKRVPVIYGYQKDGRGDELWQEVYRSPEDQPGYIARVVRMDPNTILAVGGDGTFPDREKRDGSGHCDEGEANPGAQDSAANGGAGKGRVWVLREGEPWRELTADEKPEDLRALTALDSLYNGDRDTKLSFAVAGGLCQLWHFEDGGFMRAEAGQGYAPAYDAANVRRIPPPTVKPVNPDAPFNVIGDTVALQDQRMRPEFRLRVRDIRFADMTSVIAQGRQVRAAAVTSGCCAAGDEQRLTNPLMLQYKPAVGGDPLRGTWTVGPEDLESTVTPTSDAEAVTTPESLFALSYTQVEPTPTNPTFLPQWRIHQLLTTALPPGEPSVNEKSSRWMDRGEATADEGASNAFSAPGVSGVRLVDADGQADSRHTSLDWAAGTLESTGQAVVLGTNPEQVPAPKRESTLGCPGTALAAECLDVVGGTEDLRRSLRTYKLLKVPLYGLNGVDIDDETGTGWGVGRYGGIARFIDPRLGASSGVAVEPPPPEVGAPEETVFRGGLYDGFRDLGGGEPWTGEVPSLGTQPTETLERPLLMPGAVTSDTVRQIVMSEDGSEGWALSGTGERAVVSHYQDSQWRPCHGQPVDTRFPGDPRCQALPVKDITFMVTVPSPDGRFRAVAVAGRPNRLFLYEDGAWRAFPHPVPSTKAFEQEFRKLVFTSHDEAWVQGFESQSGSDTLQDIFHYDAGREGEKWVACTVPPPVQSGIRKLAANCDDPDGRLDFGVGFPVTGAPPSALSSFTLGTAVSSPKIVGMAAAGGRAYFYGSRVSKAGFRYPAILVYDGEKWSADPDLGGWDPGCPRLENRVCQDPVEPLPEEMGQVRSLVIDDAGTGVSGWAFGSFSPAMSRPANADLVVGLQGDPPPTRGRYPVARFEEGGWVPGLERGVLTDYPEERNVLFVAPPRAGSLGGDEAVVARGPLLLAYESSRKRFELPDQGRPPASALGPYPIGRINVVGAARGEAWLGIDSNLFHYTREVPRDVFQEVGHPIRSDGATAATAGPDGSLWLLTASDRVFRHDPLTGWDSISIPGWSPGRLTTAAAPANAIALGSGGEGLIVGDRGRIARIDGRSVTLDRASGAGGCAATDPNPTPPCGTGWDLQAAAVAPDGAGLVVGESRVMLWRPAGGDFRPVGTPSVPKSAEFTGVSMPTTDRAWVSTGDGRIFAGSRVDQTWTWEEESRDSAGRQIAIDRALTRAPLNAIAVRADGTGVAAGARGVLLERSAAGAWERVESGVILDLLSVALADGPGAIVGGAGGLVLTRTGGRWEVARVARWPFGGYSKDGDTVAVALADGPGDTGGEAWAVTSRVSGDSTRVWRYSSGEHPTVETGLRPLPDSPPARPGELAFAAWGKTECHNRTEQAPPCLEMTETESYQETISRRTIEEVSDATERGELHGALFTGDAIDSAAHQGHHATGDPAVPFSPVPTNGRRKLVRWRELIADRLESNGVPFLVGPGGQDLASNQVCAPLCTSASRFVHAGENLIWRSVLNGRLGTGPDGPESVEQNGLRFRQLEVGALSARADDTAAPGLAEPLPTGGGADTHFAVDVEDADTSETRLRIVFADTSMRSLSASDPMQQPLEPRGGQALWVERVLCFAPGMSTSGEPCTRKPGQPAVVVTNTPTYTYYAGALATQPDGAAFEELMLRHRVSAVVSGRIGWNGLYWTLAPALHSPCPGGQHPAGPPSTTNPCEDSPGGSYFQGPPGSEELGNAIGGAAPPPPGAMPAPPEGFGQDDVLPGQSGPPVPFVVASGGGGKFASEADADGGRASQGFWHGYSVVRVSASGNSGETIVEQRPIYDFVTIEAQERSLRPGQRMTLRGWGRGPVAAHESAGRYRARFDRIDNPAVTHRYDLVMADPQRPSLPLEDANGDYVPVPARVASVDRQSGLIRAGRGTGERTYAIGLLSVGDKAAGYPMAFEPRRSFAAQRAKATLPPLPRPARAPAAQAPIRVAETPPPPSAPPPASPASPMSSQTLQPPTPPQLPSLPPAQAPPTPHMPAPPAMAPPPPPPAPPALPTQQQPQPLALGAKLQAVAIVPSVNPPAPPPVNPAPPGGAAARKEAKQRQAATAKSEEGGGDSAAEGDGAQARINTASDPSHGSSRLNSEHAFTRLERPAASPAIRGLLYSGGLGLAALALAAGFLTLRPRTRERRPLLPAAALARVNRRR
jgi:hypothetical protein